MKAFIFNLDSVIVNSNSFHCEVDKMILESLGRPVTVDYIEQFAGYTNREMWKQIKEDLKLNVSVEDLITKQVILKLILISDRTYSTIAGVTELMQDIVKNNIEIGVASSSPSLLIDAVLRKTGIHQFVSIYKSVEDVSNKNPAPDLYLKVAQNLQVKPDNVCVLENSKKGVEAAKAAGMKCIALQKSCLSKQELALADHIVTSVNEIDVKEIIGTFGN